MKHYFNEDSDSKRENKIEENRYYNKTEETKAGLKEFYKYNYTKIKIVQLGCIFCFELNLINVL
jgi:hypothetical protein